MEIEVLRFGGRIAVIKSCAKVNGEIVVEAEMTHPLWIIPMRRKTMIFDCHVHGGNNN